VVSSIDDLRDRRTIADTRAEWVVGRIGVTPVGARAQENAGPRLKRHPDDDAPRLVYRPEAEVLVPGEALLTFAFDEQKVLKEHTRFTQEARRQRP
jgi:hypothetical protein